MSDSAVGRPLHRQVTRCKLESVRQTREDFTDLFFDFDSLGGGVERGLVVAGGEVDGRALAQAVFVLRGETHVVEVAFFNAGLGRFSRAVDIVGADRQVAVADRNDRAEVSAEALTPLSKSVSNVLSSAPLTMLARALAPLPWMPLKYWPITKVLAKPQS